MGPAIVVIGFLVFIAYMYTITIQYKERQNEKNKPTDSSKPNP